jgi:gamma-glutamyltranspeptidase/glutathione hydrolase
VERYRSPVFTKGGIVCSTSPLAASAGARVLLEGGNAFDAAITVAAVEAVTVPPMCGIGGDVFAILYHAPSGRLVGINGSGGAPSGATPEFFRSRGYTKMPLEGPLSISVPGEVDAWETIHREFCTWPFKRLLDPAIGYAEEGFPVLPKLSPYFATSADKLARYPSSASVFLKEGRPLKAGDVLVIPGLAESLRRIAEGGAEEFYRGDLARAMVKAIREAGGLFTYEDFASHRTEVYEPISTTYRGYTVYQTRPPSQGLLLLEMLNILEGFDLASLGHNTAETIHLMVEAKKLAFADRNRYAGDPSFVGMPLEELISKEWAARRRSLIDPGRASAEVPAGVLAEADGDTSYFCIVDREGNAVSFIHSLSNAFGSGFFVAGETGILLNNRAGRGFSLEEGHPNLIAPGKRTMHTLNCYMVFKDGRPWLVGGTPGGDFQPQGNAQIITDLIDFGLEPQEAVEAPRWWSFPGTDPDTIESPFEVRVEPGMPEETLQGLRAKGHRVVTYSEGISHGVVQLIMFDHERGIKIGASDPRGDGHAAAT